MARSIKINDDGTYTIKLRCVSTHAAEELFKSAERPGDKFHNVALEGDLLAVTYMDIRWPMDVAEAGVNEGYVDDAEAGDIFHSVQLDPEVLES